MTSCRSLSVFGSMQIERVEARLFKLSYCHEH
jgi:hypothetical protein